MQLKMLYKLNKYVLVLRTDVKANTFVLSTFKTRQSKVLYQKNTKIMNKYYESRKESINYTKMTLKISLKSPEIDTKHSN